MWIKYRYTFDIKLIDKLTEDSKASALHFRKFKWLVILKIIMFSISYIPEDCLLFILLSETGLRSLKIAG